MIVDALSEREPATQRHVEQSFGEDASLNAIVITSRTEPMLGAVDRATLYPVRLDAVRIQAAQILGVVSLGPNLVPQDFSRHEAADALARGGTGDQAQSMIDRLIASGLIERRMPGGIPILRFSLDPAAEYLAGIRKLFELKGVGQQGWHSYLGELTQHDGYPDLFDGYLTALAVCYRAYRQDFNLPEIHFRWEDEGKDPHPGGREVGSTV